MLIGDAGGIGWKLGERKLKGAPLAGLPAGGKEIGKLKLAELAEQSCWS